MSRFERWMLDFAFVVSVFTWFGWVLHLIGRGGN